MSTTPLLRLPAVISLTQLSRSTIYAAIQAGTFPRPVRVGERAVRWRSGDIDTWLAGLGGSQSPKGPAIPPRQPDRTASQPSRSGGSHAS